MYSRQKNSSKLTLIKNIEDQPQNETLWTEIQIHSKNLPRRSYHTSVIHDSKLYIYGGYDINTGILGDFYSLDLLQKNLKWEPVNQSGSLKPSPRHSHSASIYKEKIWIFGGKIDTLNNTNQLWSYCFQTSEWALQNHSLNIGLDSHCSIVFQDSMYVFGGFVGAKVGKYSNVLYKFNFLNHNWTTIQIKGKIPSPRANSAICIVDNTKLYMFGGSDLSKKYNDIWKFQIQEGQWQQIETGQTDNELPDSRAGHSMVCNGNFLIVFGGIHDITHQKNDMIIFNIKTKKWKLVVDQMTLCSANQSVIQTLNHHSDDQNQQYKARQQNTKKQIVKGVRLYKPLKDNNYNNIQITQNHQQKQQRSKQDIKKLQLLSQFQLTHQQKQRFRNPSPTLQALKNSILAINSPHMKKKTNINKNIPKQKKIGKPCARDGHSAVIFEGKMIIVGGDRHMMSLNDMFMLRLQGI